MTLATTEIQPTASIAEKIGHITGWILAGASERQISEAINKHWPNTKARPLIVQAMKGIAKAGDADPEIARAWCIECSREVYRRAMEINDLAAALRAINLIHKFTEGAPC